MSDSKRTPVYLIMFLLLILVIILAIQAITVAKLYTDQHPESRVAKITQRVDELENTLENKAEKLKHRIGTRLISNTQSPESPQSPESDRQQTDDLDHDALPLEEWSPFQEMRHMRDQVDRMFGQSLERFWGQPGFDESWLEKPYVPAADFESKEDRYLLSMDIPGIDKSKLEVSLQGLLLQIKGEREQLIEHKQGEILRTERRHGQFLRAFTMPSGIDPEKSTAEYKDGVLTVTIPKGDKTDVTQKIEVQ